MTPTKTALLVTWPRLMTALGLTLLLLIGTVSQAAQVAVPARGDSVIDLTHSLDEGEKETLREQVATLEEDTGAVLAVLVVPTTGDDSIEQYATRVFDVWKLGSAEKDNGLLMLVALADRRMRIEVGQGLEGAVPDVLAGRIIDQQMKPRFRDEDYAGGIEAAITALGQALQGQPITDDGEADVERRAHVTPFGWALLATALTGFALGFLRAKKSWHWQLMVPLLLAGPVIAAGLLRDVGMGVMLCVTTALVFGLGLLCGRSRIARWIVFGLVAVIGTLVTIAMVIGADKFWWAFLIAMAAGVVCMLLVLIAMGMRGAWERGGFEFGFRASAVLTITGFVLYKNWPDGTWSSWIPTAAAAGVTLLFGFFPSGGGGSSNNDARGSSSSRSASSRSSRSSSSSSSSSSSGGSSSGGGASGSW